MSIAPGWYPDPAEPTTQRYWDGEGWLGRSLPIDATPPEGPLEAEATPPAVPESPTGGPGKPTAEPVTGRPGGPPSGGPGAPAPGTGPVPGGLPPRFGYGTPVPRPHGMVLASLGERAVAKLIDLLLVFGLACVANIVLFWRLAQEFAPIWEEAVRRSGTDPYTPAPVEANPQLANLIMGILAITTLVWFVYETPMVARQGQTIGKRLMRIQVVSLREQPKLTFGQAAGRWSTYGMPTLLWYCCGIGLLLQLLDALSPLVDPVLRQALHDRRAQTVVVRVPAGSADARPNPPGDPA